MAVIEKYALGSGKLYTAVYDGETIPDDATIETDVNNIGRIKGGASLEYTAERYEDEDDLGYVKINVITKENVVLKAGVMTWNGNTLARLCSTARVSEAGGKRTVKIGGLGNQSNTNYVIRFVHEDTLQGNTRVTIVGKNTSGFTLAYAQDAATVIDCEFTAIALDSDATLVILEEEIKSLGTLTVTSEAGETSGTTAISVTPAKGTSSTYKYKTASSVTMPTFDEVLTTGWTIWDGSSDITATTGDKIVIAEVDSTNKCKNAGQATVVSKA